MPSVLVVDDGMALRVLLADVLRRAGYAVSEATDGGTALASMQRSRPDAVVLDLYLRGGHGLSVLRRMRGDPALRAVPVIVLTGDSSKGTVTEAVRLGISGYVLKNRFTIESLLEPLARAVSPPPALAVPASPEPAEEAAGTQAEVKPIRAEAGDPAAGLRDLKPLISRSEVLERVGGCEQLRAFSPTVSQLLSLTADPNTSMARVVKAITQDHAVALKILRLANSVIYTRGESVTSVKSAVMRIGMENIRQAVLNIGVVEHFSAATFGEHLSLAQFWEHAISTGLIAAEITHARDPAAAEAAFTGGLLHDVGRLVYIEQLGPVYQQALRAASEMGLPLEQVEARLLLLSHADVMDKVLHSWKFPKDLINPLVFHHLSAGNIRQVAVNQLEGVATMGLANRLSHALLLGSSGNQAIYAIDDLCRMLRLDPALLISIEQSIPAQTADMKLAMLSRGGEQSWTPRREEMAKRLERPFRPLFVSADTEYDAFRILCRTLGSGEGGPEAPNVGVVNIAHARDRVMLTTRFKQAEAEAGAANLPLIVLSPTGKLTLEDGFMAGRRAQHLATPFVLPRFLRAVNEATASAPAARAAA